MPADGLGPFSGPRVERRDGLEGNAEPRISLPLQCASCDGAKGRNFGGYFHLTSSRSVKRLCPQASSQQPTQIH